MPDEQHRSLGPFGVRVTGNLTPDAEAALTENQIQVGSTGTYFDTRPAEGQFDVAVQAVTDSDAIGKVTRALAGHGDFSDLRAVALG